MHLQTVRKYLHLLEKFETDERAFANILHPQFEQTEYPNALNKNGQKSNYAETFKRMNIGKTILASQFFLIQHSITEQSHCMIEAQWEGTMAVDAGPLKKGQTLKAFFCMIFEFKDGLIYRQKNYDCFEPF